MDSCLQWLSYLFWGGVETIQSYFKDIQDEFARHDWFRLLGRIFHGIAHLWWQQPYNVIRFDLLLAFGLRGVDITYPTRKKEWTGDQQIIKDLTFISTCCEVVIRLRFWRVDISIFSAFPAHQCVVSFIYPYYHYDPTVGNCQHGMD